MPNGSRERDGELARRIDLAKDEIGNSPSGFLPEIPALDHRGGLSEQLIDRDRAADDQQNHCRLPQLQDGICQVFLPPNKVQIIPVTQMVLTPGFAADQFIFAQDQDNCIAPLRRADRGGNQSVVVPAAVGNGVFVDKPVKAGILRRTAG